MTKRIVAEPTTTGESESKSTTSRSTTSEMGSAGSSRSKGLLIG